MPSLLTTTFLLPIAKTILKKTGHDVVNLDIVGLVEKVKVPALFIVGDEDLITPNEKVFSIYKSYKGAPKKFLVVQGEHHTERANGDLTYAVSFVADNIGFVLDRSSWEPDPGNLRFGDKAEGWKFNTVQDGNFGRKALEGVSKGEGLGKVMNFSVGNAGQGVSWNRGSLGDQNDGLSSDVSDVEIEEDHWWDKMKDGAKEGWKATKNGLDKFTTSLVEWGPNSCGCVDNVDKDNQDDSGYFESGRESLGDSLGHIGGGGDFNRGDRELGLSALPNVGMRE
jgi:hypothetical protein